LTGGIEMQLGPMTRAACAPDSRDSELIDAFTVARVFTFRPISK
jgi:hypothetical protein